jgi:putative N6-adenine-specific DNA methylase
VRGARAVDVGASTGGFTDTLLRFGARHVVAVDAGRDQLHPRLRADARVESLEQAEWKTLSLTRAPGPFDFFTVDVSFVAARNMLRGLAFRLRDGAHGVVLVKPQFELPERQLRAAKAAAGGGGQVDDPALRMAALARVTEKAQGLGFTVLGHADSPVPGGSGTVELLAHLRFDGRPASLPQPGERRRDAAEDARAIDEARPDAARGKARPGGGARARVAASAEAPLRWFAVTAPGLEEVAAREASAVLAAAGATDIRRVDGGVELSGPPEVGYRANLWLRIATRVLARAGEATARDFGRLRHGLAALPWERFIPAGAKVDVSASTSRCRLYHTGAIAETVELAIADRLAKRGRAAATAPRGAGGAPDAGGEAAAPSVLVRGVEDRFVVSVDSSGELLHRRGWRQENAAAPLRETLAAGLLALCDWAPSTALFDPMCGAGTIPLEAAAQALGIAPGLQRGFAFERWPLHEEESRRDAWARMRDEARASAQRAATAAAAPIAVPVAVPIVGADRSAEAIAGARRNAERAGLAGAVRLERAELTDARPPAERGLVLVNPPYGRRIGNPRALGLLYREIGFVLRSRFRGWRAGILVADRRLGDTLRLPVAASFPLNNGGLRVTLLRCEL